MTAKYVDKRRAILVIDEDLGETRVHYVPRSRAETCALALVAMYGQLGNVTVGPPGVFDVSLHSGGTLQIIAIW